MKSRTGIELFLSALKEYNIDHIFGNPGTSESAITNSLALPEHKDFKYFEMPRYKYFLESIQFRKYYSANGWKNIKSNVSEHLKGVYE